MTEMILPIVARKIPINSIGFNEAIPPSISGILDQSILPNIFPQHHSGCCRSEIASLADIRCKE
jgi:hypothetical protein